MTYTATQIEKAKRNYNSFLVQHTLADYDVETIGHTIANERMEYHNQIVTAILEGDKELEKKWKLFFLHEEVKSSQKSNESKAKKTANKESSADILSPIKEAKRMVEFGKWLNTQGNPFRKEHFSKKYTKASVNKFLSL